MKRLTFILLISITFIAAKCQNPDTLTYYSTAYVDSIINDYEQRIENLSSLVNSDLFLSNLDTVTLRVNDGIIQAEIKKEGHNIWTIIQHGERRLNADYIDYKRRIILADSLKTTGSWYPD